jgi:phosphotransacetylase/acyl dehydratase
MSRIENRTFAELKVGDSASIARTLTQRDIELFAVMSGDVNPAHVDEEYARSDMFHHVIAHGMWGGALISTVLGTQLPGPGAIYLAQSLRFRHPVAVGDTITVTVKVAEKLEAKNRVLLDCVATNENGEVVISGTAEVIAPTEKISRERINLPEVKFLQRGRQYHRLIEGTKGLLPIRTAVVHPVDGLSLLSAAEAARMQLIVPILIGPEPRIRAAAEQVHLDLGAYEILHAPHSHAAAELAVSMARELHVDALMKGAIATEELMHFVDSQPGLRTERRISQVFAADVPSYSRPLFITDAALNTFPNIEEKRDIVQNTIDLLHALGIAAPKVAILSAQETVSARLPSTLDAAVLCKMADRGQITGAILDGPLGFDTAISDVAAKSKGITSLVAGQADIFVVPDLEAGNILVEQLRQLADAQVAGLVLGGKVPIIVNSRQDDMVARLASCALALLLVRRKESLSAQGLVTPEPANKEAHQATFSSSGT